MKKRKKNNNNDNNNNNNKEKHFKHLKDLMKLHTQTPCKRIPIVEFVNGVARFCLAQARQVANAAAAGDLKRWGAPYRARPHQAENATGGDRRRDGWVDPRQFGGQVSNRVSVAVYGYVPAAQGKPRGEGRGGAR